MIKDSKVIDNNYMYQQFNKQLTKWMRRERLDSVVSLFKKYHSSYLIKSNRKKKNTKYAVFIKPNNRLRRGEDLIFNKRVKLNDLLLLTKKQEGVPLITTLYNSL